MNKNWITPDMSKFAVLCLCHERPDYNKTVPALRRSGYTGRIFVILDNLDTKQDDYIKKYGYENIFVFNKSWVALESDAMNNFGDRRATLFVRNISFEIAKELGIEYFVQMDDDYYYFGHRGEHGAKKTSNLDLVFEYFIEFLLNTNVKSIAFSQGGDHIGGYKEDVLVKRKAMNSFFCITDRPFKFYGVMNDDVNCYLTNGRVGDIFLTYMAFQLDQADTQSTNGGMSETYQQMGTYLKSFTSVMASPSCVKVKLMGCNATRLHHSIDWRTATPMILNEKYKKY